MASHYQPIHNIFVKMERIANCDRYMTQQAVYRYTSVYTGILCIYRQMRIPVYRFRVLILSFIDIQRKIKKQSISMFADKL